MTTYMWQFLEWTSDPDPSMALCLNVAVVEANSLANSLERLGLGQVHRVRGLDLPPGCPRHLDNAGEVINDKTLCFTEICFRRVEDGPLKACIDGLRIDVYLPTAITGAFISAIRESQVVGYFCDNELPIDISKSGLAPESSEVIFWSTDDLDVIYY